MTTDTRKILVTSALLYANGSIHLGHMVELVQTDIWVRFQRMRGHECFYVCGDDAHGTPIMLNAEKLGMTPTELIESIGLEHNADFRDFNISVDNYYTTHSDSNKRLAEHIYNRLNDNGDIEKRTILQAYDPEKGMFLPDRYIRGECPRCGAKDQYGDNCEHCGSTYSPTELIDPISSVSGARPIEKSSEHYFFRLDKYADMLNEWTKGGHLQDEVVHKLNEWLKFGLEPWDISRDAPYFGFKIPNTTDKYFYVWLDAPIGYMASFENLCEKSSDLKFEDFWNKESEAELYHFVGKDIVYFHGLFWPAMLHGSGFRTPTAIFTHGFLTVNGKKMSKSRGTFIKARTYLNHFDSEYLRYYFAAKLSKGIDDLDMNFEDFMRRINSDLVGKVVNIASRCAGFINKRYEGMLYSDCSEPSLCEEFVIKGESIAAKFEERDFAKAVREIMELADRANQYINDKKPWALAKQIGKETEVHAICSTGLNLFRILMIYLKPIIPVIAEKAEFFLNIAPMTWDSRKTPLLKHEINAFKPLVMRIEQIQLDALKDAAQKENTQTIASRHATS